jgi:hypothetical protein
MADDILGHKSGNGGCTLEDYAKGGLGQSGNGKYILEGFYKGGLS